MVLGILYQLEFNSLDLQSDKKFMIYSSTVLLDYLRGNFNRR